MTTTERSLPVISTPGDVAVETDDFSDALSNPRRRFPVACLAEHSRSAAMADVADELRPVHVPSMADDGGIEYGSDGKPIGLRDPFDGIATAEPPLPALSGSTVTA